MNEIEEFRIEVEEQINKLDQKLVSLTKESFQLVKKDLMRTLHNIKGSAGMLGFKDLEDFCHKLEDIVSKRDYKKEDEDAYLSLTGQLETFSQTGSTDHLDFEKISSRFKDLPGPPQKTEKAQEELDKPAGPSTFKASVKLPNIDEQIHVAIIEDEDDLRQILKKKFEKIGIVVHDFPNGPSFFEANNINKYHLLITDKNLPDLNGVEIIRKVKRTNSLLPILIISGYLDEESLIECGQLGTSGIIPKPFKTNYLLQFSINCALNYVHRLLLERLMKTVGYQLSNLIFEQEFSKEDINHLVNETRAINLQMIKIKKYFAQLSA